MSVQYKLEVFEGPLDLLLHLIDKNEVDIYNIPINDITNQYMAYLGTMDDLQMDVTSDFLIWFKFSICPILSFLVFM